MSTHELPRTNFEAVRDLLVKQRVTISLCVAACLILKDIITGTRPHDTGNVHDPWAMFGLACVLVGVLVRSWAAGVINKTKVLATTGPYRLCRHPLYLGSLLMMLGFCVLVGNVADAVVVFGPILFVYLLTMQREELRLAARYGEAWYAYAAAAPRIFPYRPFADLRAPWSFAQWLNNREYKAACTSLAALVVLHLWRVA